MRRLGVFELRPAMGLTMRTSLRKMRVSFRCERSAVFGAGRSTATRDEERAETVSVYWGTHVPFVAEPFGARDKLQR